MLEGYLSTEKIMIFDDSPFILDKQHSAWLEPLISCADYCQAVGRTTGSQILNLKLAEIQSMTFFTFTNLCMLDFYSFQDWPENTPTLRHLSKSGKNDNQNLILKWKSYRSLVFRVWSVSPLRWWIKKACRGDTVRRAVIQLVYQGCKKT